MTMLNVIRGDVLAPLPNRNPAGVDLSLTPEWAAIRSTRPNLWDTGSRGEWERAEPHAAGWSLLRDLAADALATKSKDLRLAIWLLESSVNLYGFPGVRDGLCVIRELLVRFWDAGLYPTLEDGDLEARSGPLDWLNEKLADAILEIPLTLRPPPAANYSAKYYRESRRVGGLIPATEFDAAAAAGAAQQYRSLRDDIEAAWSELVEVEQACARLFPPDGISLVETKDAFTECRRIVDGIVRARTPAEAAREKANGRPAEGSPHGKSAGIAGLPEAANGAGDESWAAAEQLARAGDTDLALASMTALASRELNGRTRFQRKLLLAGICLDTGRARLGRAILEELAELIDKHNLEQWESTDMVSAVWTGLYRCYTNDAGGAADPERAGKLFERLCRLNPWQALACGDGK